MTAAEFTESIADCRLLLDKALPGWLLHLGFDGSGLFPYAVLSQGDTRIEAQAPTVPLAILRALMETIER